MSNVLTDTEVEELAELGTKIKLSLECNINDTGVPCRTDRLAAVELMVEYLQIHDYRIAAVSEDGHHRFIS